MTREPLIPVVPAARARRGFSLVELLLAVFILAIGIISVAAIFPAGIAQQVQTKDAIYGPIVAEQAVGVLRSKLDQEDFGTFEQFGLEAGDRYQVNANSGARDPEVLSDAQGTIPGDWGWMRPSFLLPSAGGAPLAPGVTPAAITQPGPLDGAIDVFSLRHTRDLAGFGALPEQSGEDGDLFYTSDFGKYPINFFGRYPGDVIRSTDPSIPPFDQNSGGGESSVLAGIPFNRAKYAVLDPYDPYESLVNSGSSGAYDYRLDPAREGRAEPLVTITQGERSWPVGTEFPEYYWDCMFRRYQGRIQVAIFVYRPVFGGAGPRSYTVNACSGDTTSDWPSESPLPARVDFPQNFTNANGTAITIPRWYPEGIDPGDPTDDMVIQGTVPQPGENPRLLLDPYRDGWQVPGQWLLDQNGSVHRVLAGRRTAGEGPVRLSQRVPYVPRQASNGNVVDENGEFTTASGAGAVKSIWFIPPETRDGITLIPVFVAVKDL